jgi:hypothetical protein
MEEHATMAATSSILGSKHGISSVDSTLWILLQDFNQP